MSRAAHRKAIAEASVGTVVAGRYRLEQLLGVGGMAEVYRAEDLSTSRRVAVKLLRADIASNPEAVERTKREGELLSELHNPAIVSVETWGQLDDGTVFLVMELLEGETLGERMRRGMMDPPELGPIVAGTCAGLHAAHARGIVHRDLKPDNIFLCPTEHGLQVKLLDFGISKFYGREKLTQTGEVLGTPRYMSPEQLGAEHDIDARVDVYALGVILYESLAAKPPFLAATPTDLIIAILHGKVAPLRSVRPDVPPDVEAVVMRAMAKVRQARFDTAMGLAEAYIDAVGGVAAVRGAQRRGMATRAMGGMKVTSAPPPSGEAVPGTRPPEPGRRPDEVAGHLRLGTFSGLEIEPEALEPPAPAKSPRTASMGSSAGAPVPNDPGDPVAARPETEESWAALAPTDMLPVTRMPAGPAMKAVPKTRENEIVAVDPAPPAVSAIRQVGPTAVMDASQAAALEAPPKRKASGIAKVLLVVAALLAGAASAAAVIAALHYFESRPQEEDETSSDPGTSRPPQQPPRSAPIEATEEEVRGEIEQRSGSDVEAPLPPEAQPAEVRPTPRERRRREVRLDPLPGLGENGAIDPMREAQRALRGGDPLRCIEILDDAIRNNTVPGAAARRRADCYEAAGRHDEAVREYQRFCRLMSDHPGIPEVRALLESWGRTCP